MRQAIEHLLKNKSLANQKAFLCSMASHDIFLAAIDKHNDGQLLDVFEQSPFIRHKRSNEPCDLLMQKNNSGDSFFLGFTDPIAFKNWQFQQGSFSENITITSTGFNDLCLLMKDVETQETGLILNPHCDNLIMDNSIFGSVFEYLQNIIADEPANYGAKNYIAMTPLEQGDFSSELLHLLIHAFIEQGWINKAWAASAQMAGAESFLLIVASEGLDNQSDTTEKYHILHQKLLETCGDFLVGATLILQSSTTSPFDAAILNYDPIFIAKTV